VRKGKLLLHVLFNPMRVHPCSWSFDGSAHVGRHALQVI
jgi:hypothetical protein